MRLKNKPRFCLNAQQSPTFFNLNRYLRELGWVETSFNWQADFSENNLQFNSSAAEQLEFKHLLAQLVAKCSPQIMPTTYCVNDHNWMSVLDEMLGTNSFNPPSIWILKPALLNNGKHIKIFQGKNELIKHFMNPNRMGGEHVLQKYINTPHLLREHHKYSIRLFVITTNYAGSFLYPHGYFNVALHAFNPKEFTDLRSHLTNEHLCGDESNVVQIPTQRFELFQCFYPQIKNIVSVTLNQLQQQHPKAFMCNQQQTLAIFGFDFMVDEHQRVWLLEANHGPCFPINDHHSLQKHLYYDFWQAFIAHFVAPIAQRYTFETNHGPLFEHI